MSLRRLVLLLQARRAPSPPPLFYLLLLSRFHSTLPAEAPAGPAATPRRSPRRIQLPQMAPSSSATPLGAGFHIELVDSDLWPAPFGAAESLYSSDRAPGAHSDSSQEHAEQELHDSDDEIEELRLRKKLFYKLDKGSKEFEENNLSLRRNRKRDKILSKKKDNAKNPKECKKVEAEKPDSLKLPKPKAKSSVPKGDPVEEKRVRVLTFNQLTDPYHLPFCLDIHVTKGSVRACFVHRVTSRVVAVAHSISKDMKFDFNSRKGVKACAAVGALLAKRAIEDDVHNAVYTPRKGDKIEGKIEIVLRAVIEHGVDVKVKLKQRKPMKKILVARHDQPR